MASFATFLVKISMMLLIMSKFGEGGSLGVNFGRQTSHKLLPSVVVDMCLANGIKKVKTFSVNEGLQIAFSGTDIELIVAISNIELNKIVNSTERTKAWLDRFVVKFLKQEVKIRYICIGVEPFSKIERIEDDDFTYVNMVVPIMVNMSEIIDNDDRLRGKVNVGVPLASDTILKPVSKPSEGDFCDEFKDKILAILQILNRTESPFMLNIYPYYSVMNNSLPVEFGLFDKLSNVTVIDGDLVYTNLFDVRYDTLVWAMRKHGYGNVKIMVSQVGWPTDGGTGANVEMAKRFYDGFLKKVASNQGTPLLPGTELDVYLYELADENQKRFDRGPFERHYGIYEPDGTPKFNLDFTLQGRDIKPESASGVLYFPERWCILDNGAADNASKVNEKYEDACKRADCTQLANGSSCSSLEHQWKVSYAFNQFFQMSSQEVMGEAACDFDGLGILTNEKPVFEGCKFPVQILSTLYIDGNSNTEMAATLGLESVAGERLRLDYQLIIIVPLLWMLFLLKGRWLWILV